MAELLVQDQGAVRVLTMNRPEKLNALNHALTRALVDGLEAAESDPAVAAIVLAGAGRAFCAGADLGEFKDLTSANPERVEERASLTATLHGLFPRMGKPVVGAVHGHAVGGGAGVALACDLVVASESARFRYPELDHGIVPALVMANLVRVVGRKKAFELVTTTEAVPASVALELGMVNKVVPDDALLAEAISLAARLAGFNRDAMRLAKTLFYRVADTSFQAALEEARLANIAMRDLREGS